MLGAFTRAQAQGLPPACTESWERYAATPEPNDVPGAVYVYEWVIDKKNVLDTILYANGDSIDIKWGSMPGVSQIGVIQHNLYKFDDAEFRCTGSMQIAYVNITGVMINIDDAIACEGDSVTFIDDIGLASNYLWNDTFESESFSLYAAKADTIKVWVRGKSVNNCYSSDTADVYIYPRPIVDITIDGIPISDTTLCGTDPVKLDAGFTAIYYNWNTKEISPIIDVKPIDPTEPDSVRYYTVTVENAFECESKDSIAIFRCDAPGTENVPIVFTPNNDGHNDLWEIEFIKSYSKASIDVYDRWGNIVFHSKGNYKPWNGTYDGRAIPMGTYYYIIKLGDNTKPITGNVLIIR